MPSNIFNYSKNGRFKQTKLYLLFCFALILFLACGGGTHIVLIHPDIDILDIDIYPPTGGGGGGRGANRGWGGDAHPMMEGPTI